MPMSEKYHLTSKDVKYKVAIVKRSRTCKFCSRMILKGERIFERLEWFEGIQFPEKTNVCLDCSGKLVEVKFIQFLKKLHEELYRLWRVRYGK